MNYISTKIFDTNNVENWSPYKGKDFSNYLAIYPNKILFLQNAIVSASDDIFKYYPTLENTLKRCSNTFTCGAKGLYYLSQIPNYHSKDFQLWWHNHKIYVSEDVPFDSIIVSQNNEDPKVRIQIIDNA